MTDHLPECEAYRDECGGGCICHHVRACEKRVLDAHIAILESAKPSGKCNCHWCCSQHWLISDLIHALKEKP